MPSIPTPTAGLSVCLGDDRLYIVGGYTKDEDIASKEVAYIESGSDHWVSVCPMNIARKFSKVCALDRFLYVLGGDNGSKYNSLERYNPTTDTWELLSSDVGITISHEGRLTAFEGNLYYLVVISTSSFYCLKSIRKYDLLQNKLISCNRPYGLRCTLRIVDENYF